MKIGAAIPVLNEFRFLPAVVGQLLKVVDRCVILRGTRSTSGAPVALAPMPALDARVEVVEGAWQTEAETRNAGMDCLCECDYVFMVDSDEIILDEDLKTLRRLCETGQHPVIAVRVRTYWKTPEWRIEPPEDGVIRMVLQRGIRIEGVREVSAPVHVSDVWCRHLSYVRTDEELREKIRLWGHAGEIRAGWFDRVWKRWDADHGLENLHPVHPEAYRRAVYDPDQELLKILGLPAAPQPEHNPAHGLPIAPMTGPPKRDDFDRVGQRPASEAIERFVVQWSDPGTKLLDAGCGTGAEGHRLFERGYRGTYVGADNNEKALAQGIGNLAGRGASFVLADLEAMPYPDRHFEIVLAKDVIEPGRSCERLLREAGRLAGKWLVLSMSVRPHGAADEIRLERFTQDLGFDPPIPVFEDGGDRVLAFRRRPGKETRADPASTHIPLLAACVARTSGPVLELGCGDYSTPLLHWLCRGRRLVTLESDAAWLARYEDLRSPTHELLHVPDWASARPIDEGPWDVALIDHAPGARRVPDIRRLMHRATFLVVHDTEDPDYGYESVLPQFRHRHDDRRVRPWTTVVSMTHPLPT